jgi:hypothetical protein
MTDTTDSDEAVARERGGFSRSALLRRGWTDGLIAEVLGWADREAENPYYSSGAMMLLYDIERVQRAEAKEAFKTLQASRKKRKPAAASLHAHA